MSSWNMPALLNKIVQDVPALQKLLTALLKMDPTGTTDIPAGAKRMNAVSGGMQLEMYDGTSWKSVGKLIHDVDTVDGFHASTAATKNTIAVRDVNGYLLGNITGNAATATEASGLAPEYVTPVKQGGSGSATASGARANLAVASQLDFTNHENLYGGSVAYGHVRLPELAYDKTESAAPYGYGLGQVQGQQIPANADLNTYTKPGFYSCSTNAIAATLKNCPSAIAFSLLVEYGAYGPIQTLKAYREFDPWFYRTISGANLVFTGWRLIPHGISDKIDGTSQRIAVSEYALALVYQTALDAKMPLFLYHVNIFISKDGDDSKNGLSAANAVATWNKAMDIACSLRLSRNMSLQFRFDGKDWGAIFVTSGFGASLVQIRATTDIIGDSNNTADLPVFTDINFYAVRGLVHNVVANSIQATEQASANISSYVKVGRMYTQRCGELVVNSGTTVDFFKVSGYNSPLISQQGGVIEILGQNTKLNFLEDCALAGGTVYALYGGQVHIRGSAGFVSFTGAAQTGLNFQAVLGGSIELNGYTGPNPHDFIPGNGNHVIGSGGSFCGMTLDDFNNIGKIEFLPYRYTQLPLGWIFLDGKRYGITTIVGRALFKNTSAEFKADWGIWSDGTTINAPNWFYADGRGPFMRAVNGTTRQVGSVELDDIKAHSHWTFAGGQTQCGNYSSRDVAKPGSSTSGVTGGPENTVLNRGMTPAMFVGWV